MRITDAQRNSEESSSALRNKIGQNQYSCTWEPRKLILKSELEDYMWWRKVGNSTSPGLNGCRPPIEAVICVILRSIAPSGYRGACKLSLRANTTTPASPFAHMCYVNSRQLNRLVPTCWLKQRKYFRSSLQFSREWSWGRNDRNFFTIKNSIEFNKSNLQWHSTDYECTSQEVL